MLTTWNAEAQVYHSITAETTIILTQENVAAADYMTATDNWVTGKSYCGLSGVTLFNMSSVGRIMTINVSGVAAFDLSVQNTTADRNFILTIGSGDPVTVAHDASGCQLFHYATGNTGDITIKLEGGGIGFVYPSIITLYPPANPTISQFVAEGVTATIDEVNKTITAELPSGTNLTTIEPIVTIGGTATSYTPLGAQNFSAGAVNYIVTDGQTVPTTATYAVTLKAATVASSEKDLTDVMIGGKTPMFNSETNTYSIVLPKASSLTQAVSFTLPIAASADFTSGTDVDLSSTQDITVTAQDNTTKVFHFMATVGTKNIAYVTLATGNDDPYLLESLLSKGYYVENVIADAQTVSFFDSFDLAILFDVVNSSNAAAVNMAGLIGTKRFLNLKAYMYGKTGWPTGGGVNFTDPDAVQKATVMTDYVSHPIFLGLTFADVDVTLVDAGGTYRALQGVTTPGSGTVIATVANNPTAANIIEDNSVESAMYMFIGLANGGSTYGLANISADGKKLLDNAVEYLLGDTKYVPNSTSLKGLEISGVTFDGTTIHNAQNVLLNVYDIAGRLIVSSTNDIQMSGISKGTYIVRSNNGVLKIALIK
ncbi:MAG: T9SS type A sorting domain-containing protein [Paludibacter sp.]|nr:T9SS type A sorting domain-containing protein [Paludibacter sp.]